MIINAMIGLRVLVMMILTVPQTIVPSIGWWAILRNEQLVIYSGELSQLLVSSPVWRP
jgi:hypothetical protein